MKQILLLTCQGCPYRALRSNYKNWCEYDAPRLLVDKGFDTFPEWCPLEDKPMSQEYKERLKMFRQVVNHVPKGFEVIGYKHSTQGVIETCDMKDLQSAVCDHGLGLVIVADLVALGG